MEIWNDTFFPWTSRVREFVKVCWVRVGSILGHASLVRERWRRSASGSNYMRNSNVVVSPRLLVFGPKGNLSLYSGHEELGEGPVFDLFLSALLCFALHT